MSKGMEPAFGHLEVRDGMITHGGGLTVRQYMAAMAMQGLLSNADLTRFDREDAQLSHQQVLNAVSSASARYADTLLAALEKKE